MTQQRRPGNRGVEFRSPFTPIPKEKEIPPSGPVRDISARVKTVQGVTRIKHRLPAYTERELDAVFEDKFDEKEVGVDSDEVAKVGLGNEVPFEDLADANTGEEDGATASFGGEAVPVEIIGAEDSGVSVIHSPAPAVSTIHSPSVAEINSTVEGDPNKSGQYLIVRGKVKPVQ